MRIRPFLLVSVAVMLVASACGSDDDSAKDTTTTKKPTESTTTTIAVDTAFSAFCADADEYVAELNKFTGIRMDDPGQVTIGDLTAGVENLSKSREKVEAAAADLVTSLQEADEADKAEDATSTTVAGEATTTTIALTLDTAEELTQQITKAENDFNEAVAGVDENTTLSEAEVEITSAAYALEVSWYLVLNEAGCTDNEALEDITKWVAALQSDLTTLGFYSGSVDGIYGPATIEAVKAFQKSVGLPETGLPDPATQKALQEKLAAQSAVQVSALQGWLAGLGLYTGPIDGIWNPQLEASVKELQELLGVPVTGTMNLETLQAYQQKKNDLEALLAAAKEKNSTSTTAAPTTAAPTTAAPTTAAPTTAAPTTAAPTTAAPPTTTTTTTTTTTEP